MCMYSVHVATVHTSYIGLALAFFWKRVSTYAASPRWRLDSVILHASTEKHVDQGPSWGCGELVLSI